MGIPWLERPYLEVLLGPVDDEPAPPAPQLRGQDGRQEAMARHPAGSRPTPLSLLNQQLDECPSCSDLAAELCDRCAEAVLVATRGEQRQPR